MKNVWKMVGGAVIAGAALGYCGYQEAYGPKNSPNLEVKVQNPIPSTKPRPPRSSYSSPPRPENQELEEARDRIREYAEEVRRNQEMSSSGNPGRFWYELPDFSDEEENEEKPWYDLSEEERTNNNSLANYFLAALDAKDYKVAESYIKHLDDVEKEALNSIIAYNYRDYLEEIIKNCQGNAYDSVFRKVIWMDVFLIDHQEIFPILDNESVKGLQLIDLIQKGEQAIQAISDCQTYE